MYRVVSVGTLVKNHFLLYCGACFGYQQVHLARVTNNRFAYLKNGHVEFNY